MKEIWKTKKIRLILPGIQFLLSFLYERLVFHFTNNVDIVQTISMNDYVSDTFERVEGYIFTKLFGLIFIFILWQMIFFIIDHIKETTWRIMTGLYAIGLVFVLLLYPYLFTLSLDNVITYSYAIRFWPEYWHNVYSSFIYGGLLEVIPLPIGITLLQYTFFFGAVGYALHRVEVSDKLAGKGKWLVWSILLLPNFLTLMTNAYRTEQYSIFCIFVFSLLVMDYVDQKERSCIELIGIILMLGLVSVWRTEGIIVGALAFGINLIFTYKRSLKKTILYIGVFLIAFLMINYPQKIGNEKYYGKDYSFINSFPSLQNILNSEKCNTDYPEYEEDLKALDAVTPIALLKSRGMDGYRRYNYHNGRADINQSMADEATGAAYMKAYYRLVLNNPFIYLKTQINAFMVSVKLSNSLYIEHTSFPDAADDLPAWDLNAWEIGKHDYYANRTVKAYIESPFYTELVPIADALLEQIKAVKNHSVCMILFGLLVPLAEIAMVLYELIGLLKKKKCDIGLALFAVALLGQAAAIVLVMPAATFVYLHAYYSCSIMLCVFYYLTKKQQKKAGGEIR